MDFFLLLTSIFVLTNIFSWVLFFEQILISIIIFYVIPNIIYNLIILLIIGIRLFLVSIIIILYLLWINYWSFFKIFMLVIFRLNSFTIYLCWTKYITRIHIYQVIFKQISFKGIKSLLFELRNKDFFGWIVFLLKFL